MLSSTNANNGMNTGTFTLNTNWTTSNSNDNVSTQPCQSNNKFGGMASLPLGKTHYYDLLYIGQEMLRSEASVNSEYKVFTLNDSGNPREICGSRC